MMLLQIDGVFSAEKDALHDRSSAGAETRRRQFSGSSYCGNVHQDRNVVEERKLKRLWLTQISVSCEDNCRLHGQHG